VQQQHSSIDIDALPAGCLLDSNQTAEVLRTAKKTLAVWRCTGRYGLPFVKVGGKVFYRAGDIKTFLERRTRLGAEERGHG